MTKTNVGKIKKTPCIPTSVKTKVVQDRKLKIEVGLKISLFLIQGIQVKLFPVVSRSGRFCQHGYFDIMQHFLHFVKACHQNYKYCIVGVDMTLL